MVPLSLNRKWLIKLLSFSALILLLFVAIIYIYEITSAKNTGINIKHVLNNGKSAVAIVIKNSVFKISQQEKTGENSKNESKKVEENGIKIGQVWPKHKAIWHNVKNPDGYIAGGFVGGKLIGKPGVCPPGDSELIMINNTYGFMEVKIYPPPNKKNWKRPVFGKQIDKKLH